MVDVTSPASAAPAGDLARQHERIEDLLRAAALLLARGVQLHAVRTLHFEVSRAMGQLDTERPPAQYASPLAAEEQHRRLLAEFCQRPARPRRRLGWKDLRRCAPEWTSWAIVIGVAAGLSLRYAFALVDRAIWQHEHPDGKWISRYYDNTTFRGSPLVRYDLGVDYNWQKLPPAGAMQRSQWSARWDTCVVVNTDVTLALTLRAEQSAKLLLDDKMAIHVNKPGHKRAKVRLRQGLRHLRIDFKKARGMGIVRLKGLDFGGTEAYHFQRPILDGDDVRCEEQASHS